MVFKKTHQISVDGGEFPSRISDPLFLLIVMCIIISSVTELPYDDAKQQYFLRSCNADKIKYGDIYVDDLEVQGVAVGVYHQLGKML